jgi:hypothetical protein
MIIQIEGPNSQSVEAATHSLEAMTRNWDHDITHIPVLPAEAAPARGDRKVIDPVSVAALARSIPPALLAAADLADRIRKRRRASELIDQTRQFAAQQVTIYLISPDTATELRGLTADQLLDLASQQQDD